LRKKGRKTQSVGRRKYEKKRKKERKKGKKPGNRCIKRRQCNVCEVEEEKLR
jgi:hypothetical protein